MPFRKKNDNTINGNKLMTVRKHISDSTQAAIQTKSAYRCAICYGKDGKINDCYPHGQIAHIDKDSTNNSEDNLVLLCIPCHNLYDSTLRQGKNLKEGTVREWRNQLYQDVASGAFKQLHTQNSISPLATQQSQILSDTTKQTLNNFLKVAGPIATALCNEGSYLAKCIQHNHLDYIEDNFSNWTISPLRCKNRQVVALQDEFVGILNEIERSYRILASLEDTQPHEIPCGYYNNIGNALNITEKDCCGDLFYRIDDKEKWIMVNLQRIAQIYHILDDMVME